MIRKWLLVNALTICLIVGWSFYQGSDSYYILSAKIISQVAFVLFLVNINMYFVLLLIRKGKDRTVKVKLAKITKVMMKYHIPIAVTAVVLIVFHAVLMMSIHTLGLQNLKVISGVLAFIVLLILLFSGVLRKLKSSGFRRKFHYRMAFIFFGFIIVHIFMI
ncbi:hypothetical protein H1D32_10860 [Anaerobacillus sp. CMMVII]|uniref:hypothetical protein n=1 Tax=Anaerobacillus sp. CMMVII TaxID=2755588 RepID=UPI0021B824DC|nr:hypothetical protein [Anaerobacillus sp. CMMVII]MCT8138212.1 hypothetical protein [Anaerobacillus sp. CMMVII]